MLSVQPTVREYNIYSITYIEIELNQIKSIQHKSIKMKFNINGYLLVNQNMC